MNADPAGPRGPLPPEALEAFRRELRLVLGRAERLAEAEAALTARLRGACLSSGDAAPLAALLEELSERGGPVARRLGEFVLAHLDAFAEPWPLVERLLAAREQELATAALPRLAALAESGRVRLDEHGLAALAHRLEVSERERGLDALPAGLLSRLVGGAALHEELPAGRPRVEALFLSGPGPRLRRLGAGALDEEAAPATREMARRALGEDAAEALWPYLSYARARHADLLALAPEEAGSVPALASIKRAEAEIGRERLAPLLAELGFERFAFGLELRRVAGVSVAGSHPLRVAPYEAALLARHPEARVVDEQVLVIAHGGRAAAREESGRGDEALSRFRAYNLDHAAALAEMLDVAPLGHARARRILDLMDRIARDYVALFREHDEDAARVGETWRRLRAATLAGLEAEREEELLSSGLTRLLLAFEDPALPSRSTTVHGLKRALHQRGLKLAFKLFESGRSTNRSVDLAHLDASGAATIRRPISYVDFDPDASRATLERDPLRLPYPVRVVAEGFLRQLGAGRRELPGVELFAYGNEVHYYVRFRNHPVFVRIDYAPPLSGGMIDLTYYGVSQYELEHHPDLSLEGIRLFFRRLDFDVQVEDLRIHARYDKERALDLGDLSEHVEALFRLAPWLMEIDWTLGSLDYPPAARREVAAAWARFFAEWGVLPLGELLTSDGRHVLAERMPGPAGTRELAWSGRPPYRDLLTTERARPPLELFLEQLGDTLFGLALPFFDHSLPLAQLSLERTLLVPLRAALERGELVLSEGRLAPADPRLFRREHEATLFARLVAAGGEELAASARLAGIVAPLMRVLRLETTGSVGGGHVQKAVLVLRGERLGLYLLRDPDGALALALYGPAEGLHARRAAISEPFESAARTDAAPLLETLRANGYLPPGARFGRPLDAAGLEEVRARFASVGPEASAGSLHSERLVPGLRAAPGRAVGPARLGIEGRRPDDLEGGILCCAAMRPEDNPYLYRASGVVSTGGGVLSHAGLMANQFGKPALIAEGRFVRDDAGRLMLVTHALEYEERPKLVEGLAVVERLHIRRREQRVLEGDLVVLDADEGVLRILGQERDALALHEELAQLFDAGRRLGAAQEAGSVLALRGRRLRARHQLEKLLARLEDAVLARHAVRELLVAPGALLAGGRDEERGALLALLLENQAVSRPARARVRELGARLRARFVAASDEARRFVPRAAEPDRVLTMRLALHRAARALDAAESVLRASGANQAAASRAGVLEEVDELAREALSAMRERYADEARAALGGAEEAVAERPRARHRLRQLQRLSEILDLEPDERERRRLEERALAARLAAHDRARVAALSERLVLGPAEGGVELQPLVGWKAANLAEVARLVPTARVPAWRSVSARAFRLAMESIIERPGEPPRPLHEAIEHVVTRGDLDESRRERVVRAMWDALRLSPECEHAILKAYRALIAEEGEGPPAFVAVRSSGLEEDTEATARAGEFDTFLYVRGELELLAYIRRAWSGLWTARAIHNRAVLGLDPLSEGGGVIIQRMVRSRVSGVLQTINPAGGRQREMVINVALGLGEGLVSGAVAADQIVVVKDERSRDRPLDLRYAIADKEKQIVHDEARGIGTRVAEVPYHQRLRAALEYVEIVELVDIALELEEAFGMPLNIEFALQDERLFVLQARPVAGAAVAWRQTRERFPLPASSSGRERR